MATLKTIRQQKDLTKLAPHFVISPGGLTVLRQIRAFIL